MTVTQKLLRRLALLQTGHPRWIILPAVILAVLGIAYTVSNLSFKTNRKDLISLDPRWSQLAEQARRFEDLDNFVVVVECSNPDRSLAFLQALMARLEQDRGSYRYILSHIDTEAFRSWALLYLDQQDLAALGKKLDQHATFIAELGKVPTLVNFFAQVNASMASAIVARLFTEFLEESDAQSTTNPVQLGFLIAALEQMQHWVGGNTNYRSPWQALFPGKDRQRENEDGYFWTKNKHHLLAFVTPALEGSSFTASQRVLTKLRRAIVETRAVFPDVQAGVTGQEALNMDEMSLAMRDMSLATLLSLTALAVLLISFWRSMRKPAVELVVLVLALSYTFALCTLVIGHLNILSVTFAPLLLGLGIDYGIHWIARYREELELHGRPPVEAVTGAMIRAGGGILLAGTAAALSFLPLVFTGFMGLVELGIITGLGLLVTTATTLVVLPALLFSWDRSPSLTGRDVGVQVALRPMVHFTRGKAATFLVAAGVLSGVALWGCRSVSFDLNLLKLQSDTAESVVWGRKLLANTTRGTMYSAALATSLQEVRDKTELFRTLPSVGDVQSVTTILPEDQEQKRVLLQLMQPIVAEFQGKLEQREAVNPKLLEDLLARIRFKFPQDKPASLNVAPAVLEEMTRVRDLIQQLREQFHGLDPEILSRRLTGFQEVLLGDLEDKLATLRLNVNARPMTVADLPESLRQTFVDQDGRYLIRIFPSADIWQPEALATFYHELRSTDPEVVGDPMTLYIFTNAFRDACIKASIYAVSFICVLLLITLRKPGLTVLAILPLVFGSLWTLGLAGLLGINLNLANSLFLPLIVGAGVEYGVIIVQRWQQQRLAGQAVGVPSSTAKGVILAGLTTTVGFGSLCISSHQGIYSLGMLAFVGSLCTLAAAVLFLPALLQVISWQRGAVRQHSPRDP